MGRVPLTCLPIIMTLQWAVAHQRKHTSKHRPATHCSVTKKDIIEHGLCGRNRKEASPHVPEGPNQSTLTDLAQQHNTSNMDEPVSATRVAQGPGGTGRDHSSDAEILMR